MSISYTLLFETIKGFKTDHNKTPIKLVFIQIKTHLIVFVDNIFSNFPPKQVFSFPPKILPKQVILRILHNAPTKSNPVQTSCPKPGAQGTRPATDASHRSPGLTCFQNFFLSCKPESFGWRVLLYRDLRKPILRLSHCRLFKTFDAKDF